MQIRKSHLSYCMNVHPARTFDEVLANVDRYATAVATRVAGKRSFGIGMWVPQSAIAATKLGLDRLRDLLNANNLYPFTFNGFPFGVFHGTEVKHRVYLPDWNDAARLAYTTDLIDLLAELLPEGVPGSISTVPVTYGKNLPANATANLLAAAQHARHVYQETGRKIRIALEPEPDCYLETTSEAIAFITDLVSRTSELRDYIGVCFDTCHLCLQGEDLCDSFNALTAADIPIAKVHISAALRCDNSDGVTARNRLAPFDEPVYMHQTRVRQNNTTLRFADLDEALAANPIGEWIVHFHVPLPFTGKSGLSSTADQLTPDFLNMALDQCANAEIETYTFDVLPVPKPDIIDSIVSEFDWVLEQILK
jgi:sugar phosphate isomerase/epimerase